MSEGGGETKNVPWYRSALFKAVLEKVLIAVLTAAILGVGALVWNSASNGQVVALLGGATKADVAGIDLSRLKLTPASIYLKIEPSQSRNISFRCNPGDILLSAACTNSAAAQGSVGPIYSNGPDGTISVTCKSFIQADNLVEGQAICLKASTE